MIFVFDKTMRETFEHIDEWVVEVGQYASDKALKILVGNKSDMHAAIPLEEAESKASSLGYQYIDASAKSDVNINCIFYSIARELIKRNKDLAIVSCNSDKILLQQENNKKKSWCC